MLADTTDGVADVCVFIKKNIFVFFFFFLPEKILFYVFEKREFQNCWMQIQIFYSFSYFRIKIIHWCLKQLVEFSRVWQIFKIQFSRERNLKEKKYFFFFLFLRNSISMIFSYIFHFWIKMLVTYYFIS